MAKLFLIIAALSTVLALHSQQTVGPAEVRVIQDQADAVLSILNERASGSPIVDDDWQRLFTSDGYVRLKAREAAMKRPLDEERRSVAT